MRSRKKTYGVHFINSKERYVVKGKSTAGAKQSGSNKALVIQRATLIDGTGQGPLEDAVIVIEGERIKSIGKSGEIQIPPRA